MADVIRKVTVEKGFDPRDFVLFAFGGAGPAHAGVFARGARRAEGDRAAPRDRLDLVRLRRRGRRRAAHLRAHRDQGTPVDPARVNRVLAELESRAEAQMAKDGIAATRRQFEFSLDVRHRGQINEVEILLPEARLEGESPRPLRKLFVDRYEKLYGRGSASPARTRDRDVRLRARR